jgi:hypothetical protein
VGAQDTTRAVPDTAGAARPAAARDTAPSTCAGQRITDVDINRQQRSVLDRSVPAAIRAPLRVLLIGSPTRPPAIEPFLLLRTGDECDEFARAESERILRAQPYVADASVRAVTDSAGGVHLDVQTVDDLHPIFGLGLSGGSLSSLKLGSQNLNGNGIYISGKWAQGYALRDGIGMRVEEYTVLDRPIQGTLNLDRNSAGSDYYGILSRPFYTIYQQFAWGADVRDAETYVGFYRPDTTRLSLAVRRRQADLSAVWRVGPQRIGYLVGAALTYEHRDPAPGGVVISKDEGIVSDPDTSVIGRYAESDRARVGVVLGLRMLSFVKAYAFDAVEGPQDVGRGVQVVAVTGPGLGSGSDGAFASNSLYGGVGTAKSFLGAQTIFEVNRFGGEWANAVVSGRLAWYLRPSRRQTQVLSMEYSGAWKSDVPYQLDLYAKQFGIRGFSGSGAPGARRLVLRAERRLIIPGIKDYLGLAAGLFADAGKMWAGTVPYGETTSMRGSVGLALLGAVPRSSRLVGRVDIAVPVTHDPRADRYDVRFTVTRVGRSFWRDPRDLIPARISAPLTNIFRL